MILLLIPASTLVATVAGVLQGDWYIVKNASKAAADGAMQTNNKFSDLRWLCVAATALAPFFCHRVGPCCALALPKACTCPLPPCRTNAAPALQTLANHRLCMDEPKELLLALLQEVRRALGDVAGLAAWGRRGRLVAQT